MKNERIRFVSEHGFYWQFSGKRSVQERVSLRICDVFKMLTGFSHWKCKCVDFSPLISYSHSTHVLLPLTSPVIAELLQFSKCFSDLYAEDESPDSARSKRCHRSLTAIKMHRWRWEMREHLSSLHIYRVRDPHFTLSSVLNLLHFAM